MLEKRLAVDDVRQWFDQIYLDRGRGYLRPPEAYRVFLSLLAPERGTALLDVACGPGHLLHEASCLDIELVLAGIDFSPVALEIGTKLVPSATLREADAAHLPFVDGQFDYVTCIGALERMPDLDAVLAEQRRVAAPDATFCFLVRNAETLVWKLLMEGLGLRNETGHQGAKNLAEWRACFENAGFRIERIVPDQWPLMWPERLLRRLGLAPSFRNPKRGLAPLRWSNEFIFVLRHA